ncbi:hypothetical protein ACFL31_01450 [Candidatus Margulisiibacteriota bacterium]
MVKILTVIVVCLLLVVPSWAARPLSTDDAGTLGQGAWEIEASYELDQPKGGGASSGSLGTGIKYGLLPSFDLGLEIPYTATGTTGIGDATLKGKLGFNDALALGIDIKLTNADAASGLGTGYVDYGLNVIYSCEMCHVNLGYTVVGQAGGATSNNNVLSYGIAMEKALNDSTNLVGEVAGSSTSSVAVNPIDLQIGLNRSLNEILTIDGGLTYGLTDGSSEYKATVGLALAL